MAKSLEQRLIDNDEQIKKIQNEQRKLRQKQRAETKKAKKQRLLNRGAYLEKVMSHVVEMSDSEYENYINNLVSTKAKPVPKTTIPQSGITTQEVEENDEK
jgi:hypothetical protein